MAISNEHHAEKPSHNLLLHTFSLHNAWVKTSSGVVVYWNNTLGFAPETVATMAGVPTLDLTEFPRIQKMVDDWALANDRTAKATEARRINDGCISVKVSARVPASVGKWWAGLTPAQRGQTLDRAFRNLSEAELEEARGTIEKLL